MSDNTNNSTKNTEHFFSKESFRTLCQNVNKKIIFPASERNKFYILEVLKRHFDREKPGHVLEIASGTGQHASYFAESFPNLTFQPTEVDMSLIDSIKAYAADTPTKNVKDPLPVDITTNPSTWNLDRDSYDYIININMIHVSPYAATEGLFKNATSLLRPGGLMVTYGAIAIDGVISPQSNVDFDRSIREKNPEWGLRDLRDLKKLGKACGVELLYMYDLPSNNKALVWEKKKHHIREDPPTAVSIKENCEPVPLVDTIDRTVP